MVNLSAGTWSRHRAKRAQSGMLSPKPRCAINRVKQLMTFRHDLMMSAHKQASSHINSIKTFVFNLLDIDGLIFVGCLEQNLL